MPDTKAVAATGPSAAAPAPAPAAPMTSSQKSPPSQSVAALTRPHDQACAQEVAPGVFVGPVTVARDATALAALGVTRVVTLLADATGCVHPPGTGIATLVVPLADTQGGAGGGAALLSPYFAAVNAFVDAARDDARKVLIHCSSGISRSGAAAIAYVMHAASASASASASSTSAAGAAPPPAPSLLDAWLRVTAVRRFVLPNDAFFRELCAFEKQLWERWDRRRRAVSDGTTGIGAAADAKATAAATPASAPPSKPAAAGPPATAAAVYSPSMTDVSYRAMAIRAMGLVPTADFATIVSAVSKAQGDVDAALAALMA